MDTARRIGREGLADAHEVAGCGRAAHVGRGLRGRHLAAGRAEGRHQLAARPLLLPDDGRPLPRGVPPQRRRRLRAIRTGDRGAAFLAHDLELADRRFRLGVQPRVRRARQPPQGDPRRDRRATPNGSGPCSSTRSRRSSRRARRCRAGSRPRSCSSPWPVCRSSSRWSARSVCAAATTQTLALVEQYLDDA